MSTPARGTPAPRRSEPPRLHEHPDPDDGVTGRVPLSMTPLSVPPPSALPAAVQPPSASKNPARQVAVTDRVGPLPATSRE
jgi:hypothetical protein